MENSKDLAAAEVENDLPLAAGARNAEDRPFIVGVGASAGGLEALERLFRSMPSDSGLSFVVIQHLSPDFKSLMDELLARHTKMAIHRVEDGMAVEADSIYLIPPKKEMIISGGRLLLTDKDPEQDLSLPIDHFFRSLAQDVGRCAVAIVLSGTGSDGSRGIRDVHEAGGLVISQSEETAKFDGMPRSAKDTGIVDLILAPEEMPQAIIEHLKHTRYDDSCSYLPSLDDRGLQGFDAIFKLLRDDYGIDFSHYKPNTVTRRIERRLSMNQDIGLEEYVERLRTDPSELNSLYKDLLIGVTRFFRDRDAFDRMEKKILPELLEHSRPDQEIRVWVAGCATGEEPYSLAILLHERLTLLGRPINVKIFAGDVHKTSLQTASTGIYEAEALTDVTPARLNRYFTKRTDGYQVANELRQMIVFARHNVIKDAPFTKLDLISCRNLLIYFQPPAQKKVLSLFHFGLKTGGVLFLGPSESPGELTGEFEALDEHWKIFKKRRDIRLPADMRLPLTVPLQPIRSAASTGGTNFDAPLLATYDRLLDEYMPPGLLLSDHRLLVHTFGDAGRYLRYRPGRPTADILDLVEGDLKMALAGAIQRASKEQAPVSYPGIRVAGPEGEEQIKLSVRPIMNRHGNLTHLFILLESLGKVESRQRTDAEMDVDEASREHVSSLETELRYTRENLQATIEELETSNEELQASNEELVAGNEELQSTNEELHSVNEELYTVNAEYQKKIVELTEMTDDMDNLLRSTDIGTIFLDRNLCIRKFTPQIGRAFDLLPQDVGRRIDSFSHNIRYTGLLDDVKSVLDTSEPVEKDVQDRDGNWFFLRVLPYKSHSKLDGVVLSLIDISTVKHAEQETHRYALQLEKINDQLRDEVALRQKAENEARGNVEKRDQFLAMLSHELRNPLSAVLNAADVLQWDGVDEETVEAARGAIFRQSQQMARLLDDLLDVSRITRGKIEIRPERLDLVRTSRDALEAVKPALAESGLTLEADLPDEPLCVCGDPARIQQIQVNLLINAIKYTPSGGRIWLSARRESDQAILRVRDTGIGIAPAMREKIFDLFVQVDDTPGKMDGGMGVGLTLVRTLVDLHGGELSLHSGGEGQGSEFVVRLPIDESSPATMENCGSENGDAVNLEGLHVLLVEDHADIRFVTSRLLKAVGCAVTQAENGSRGIDAIMHHRPDVALIDIGLPDMNGYDVARRIRELPEGRHVRLLAVTGFGQPEDRQKALDAGFDDHLIKPLEYQVLMSVIRSTRGLRGDGDGGVDYLR